ncbi:hypothetical protein BX666DRAFT_2017807 [Dichotomocladium elegans]|nr:hypothetical protein BX666DRAFT_2017807 [Dichotomocladium elegans]
MDHLELYYLIYRFLSSGPCKETGRVLWQELQEANLLPGEPDENGTTQTKTKELLVIFLVFWIVPHCRSFQLIYLCQEAEFPRVDDAYLPRLIKALIRYYKQSIQPDNRNITGDIDISDISLMSLCQTLEPHESMRIAAASRKFRGLSRYEIARLPPSEYQHLREVGIIGRRPGVMASFLATTYNEGSDDQLVKVWDARSGHLIHTIRGHENAITDIAINEENTLIATASMDGYVRVWKMEDYSPVATLKSHAASARQRKPFTSVRFSPSPCADTRYLMSTNEDGVVRLWKWNNETLEFSNIDSPIAYMKPNSTEQMSSSQLSALPSRDPAEQPQAATQKRKRIQSALFPLKSGIIEQQDVVPIAHLEGHNGSVTDLAYSHMGDRILSGSQDGTARVWAYKEDTERWESFDPPRVTMITWTADDTLCIVATSHGDIKVYKSYTGKIHCILKGHTSEVYAVDSHPVNPRLVVSAGYDGRIILWDVNQLQAIKNFSYQRTFLDCKFSRDGFDYAVTDQEGKCTLFSINPSSGEYNQVKEWVRGQYFYSDYLPIRIDRDGTVLDDQTSKPPHTLPYTLIRNEAGIEYGRQKKEGYGRDLKITMNSMEAEYLHRLEEYINEEERIKTSKPMVPAIIDRSYVTRKRKEFVPNDEEEEQQEVAIPEPDPTPPIPSAIPDDPNDEDYNEEHNQGEDSSEEDSDSAMFEGNDEVYEGSDDYEDDDDGPVTRSRAGRLRRRSPAPSRIRTRQHSRSPFTQEQSVSPDRSRTVSRRATSRTRGRGRGRPPTRHRYSGRSNTGGRRQAEDQEASRSEDDHSGRPRRWRRQRTQVSYRESDLDEENDSEEEIDVDVVSDTDHGSVNDFARPQNESDSSTEVQIVTRKRQLRSTAINADSDEDFEDQAEVSTRSTKRRAIGRNNVERAQPVRQQPSRQGRTQPRQLTRDEITQYEPREWLKTTVRNVVKYHPQVGDQIAIISQGHREYWQTSELKERFNEKHGPIDTGEPFSIGTILNINWIVGPPTFCQLKVRLRELKNGRDALINGREPIWAQKYRDIMIDYSDEDGSPEFIVLWEQFVASMQIFKVLKEGQRVDALYDVGKYTGTIAVVKPDVTAALRNASVGNPWARYHIIWDDEESQPEDLSPWEIVPSGEDFNAIYDVGGELTPQEKKRANDILNWLIESDDFQLYVDHVDYYQYPNYLSQIAYPMCLTMIQERLQNNFYRQSQASKTIKWRLNVKAQLIER